MTNRKNNKKQDLETRLYNNTVNVALYLIYRLSKHASLSMREIELRCGTSSKSIRKTQKGVSPSLKTIHKNINCCLSEMKYDASPVDECLICPSVIGFANAYIGTDAPEAGSSRLIAIIGTLFSTFRRNSESAENSVSEVARIMDILGEQNRFKIVLRLLEGSAYVGELAKYLGLAPCTVSQHLSVLLGANRVKSADIGRRVYYSLNKERTDCFLDALCGLMKKDE